VECGHANASRPGGIEAPEPHGISCSAATRSVGIRVDPLNGGRDLLLAFYSGSGGCSLLGELCAGPNDLAPSVTCRWDDGWAPWSESSCARSCLLTKSSGPCDASFFARAAFK
jgi:hypothetical protein